MLSSKVHLLRRILQLLFLTRVALADTLTVTITAYPDFLNQRSCALYCYVNDIDGQYDDLGCSTPVENSCYCRDDLIPSMVSSLSSCVSASCSGDSDDVYSATSIYEGYCSSNGYVAAATTAAGSGGNTQGATAAATSAIPSNSMVTSPTSYSSPSSLSSSSSSSNSQNNGGSGGLSTGAIALISVAGSLAGIVSAIIAVYKCRSRGG